MGLPPPPTKAEPGSYAWVDWNTKLTRYLNQGESVPWSIVDKAGSSLGDLQDTAHSHLSSVLGGGSYHLSNTQYTRVSSVISKAGFPTTSDIAAGQWAIYKDTSGGTVRLWANDGGVMKSVTLT